MGTIEVVEAACDVTIPVARTALGGCQRTYIFRSFSESSGTPVLVQHIPADMRLLLEFLIAFCRISIQSTIVPVSTFLYGKRSFSVTTPCASPTREDTERLAERETLLHRLGSKLNRTVLNSCGNPIIRSANNT